MNYFINPKRKTNLILKNKIIYFLKYPIVNLLCSLGFMNYDYSFVHGDTKRIKIGKGVSTTNTLFNTVCGNIVIGDNTIFGHDCMVLTGRHRFLNGMRAKLVPDSEHFKETPEFGYDIVIGNGCFIASGVIILAPVTIGNNVLIGAGSVVTSNIPDNCFIAGVPAKIVKYHSN